MNNNASGFRSYFCVLDSDWLEWSFYDRDGTLLTGIHSADLLTGEVIKLDFTVIKIHGLYAINTTKKSKIKWHSHG